MFNWHVLKVIIGFCAIILLGLISLVIIDSFKERGEQPVSDPQIAAPSKTLPPVKKQPAKKPSTSSKPKTQ